MPGENVTRWAYKGVPHLGAKTLHPDSRTRSRRNGSRMDIVPAFSWKNMMVEPASASLRVLL